MYSFFKSIAPKFASCVLIACCSVIPAVSQAAERVDISQARGADQRVNYASLTKYGPWDDRNYNLSKADLAVLAPNESELHPQIPAGPHGNCSRFATVA